MTDRYTKFSTFLKQRYGEKVRKISVDAGFTCPNKDAATGKGGCIFCRNDSFSKLLSEQDVCIDKQIDQGIQTALDWVGIKKYIVYFQSSTNTFAPVDVLHDLFFAAIDRPGVVGIAIATRPDCLPSNVVGLIEELSQRTHVWVELGLQSSHNTTLHTINRGHTWEDYLDAVEKLLSLNVRICTHLMLGLPGEGADEIRTTAEQIAKTRTHEVKIHPLLILADTGLEAMYKDGLVKALNMQDYISQACDMLERLPKDMVIQRLTAESRIDEVLAPDWIRNKLQVLQAIERELKTRGTRQGSLYHA